MADFVIPKGKDFEFVITVMERDSFLPQDLANMDTATLELMELSTNVCVTIDPGEVTLTKLADPDTDPATYLLGRIECTLGNTFTSKLTVLKGSAVDAYYLKPVYKAIIQVTFTDGTPDMTAIVPKVYVTEAGC